jgi:hypothetical protein
MPGASSKRKTRKNFAFPGCTGDPEVELLCNVGTSASQQSAKGRTQAYDNVYNGYHLSICYALGIGAVQILSFSK